jgi:hypothetical protein
MYSLLYVLLWWIEAGTNFFFLDRCNLSRFLYFVSSNTKDHPGIVITK